MRISTIIAFFFLSLSASAQKYFGISGEQFGANIVQKKRFDWRTIKTNNFEFNFYRGGEEIARNAALKAETDYNKITETLGYTPFSVMKVFIYNNSDDLMQSNLGNINPSAEENKNVNLSKARIQIPHNKNDSLFNVLLIKEISTLFVFDMLYGGSLKESMQSQLLLSVPDWFVMGITSYIGSSFSAPKNAEINTLINKYGNKRIASITGADAELIGHSIWYYISQRYGKDNISNILNLTRIIRNEQSSITSTLSISFTKFIKEWKAYYANGQQVISTPVPVTALETKTESTPIILKPGQVDTDNYVFDQENIDKFKNQQKSPAGEKFETTKASLPSSNNAIKIGPIKAYNNLLVNNANGGSIIMDPVRRFGLGYNLIFNDLLENNILKVNAYIKASSPFFRNYDYSLQYGHYNKRIDYQVRYEKRSINIDGIDESNNFLFRPLNIFPLDNKSIILSRRLISQRFGVDVIYPISKSLKVIGNPSILRTTDIEYELPGRNNANNLFISPNIQVVFDNSVNYYNRADLGTKAKFTFERNVNFANEFENFDRMNIDARHSQKLLKGLIIESRLNMTRSSGAAPKYSILGGVENGLNRKIYAAQGLLPGPEGDFKDLLFYNFPGQLRGHDFARIFGNSHVLSNTELRLLLADYLPKSSLSSTFLKNLQLVTFYDIGTAWKGNKGPFSKQNSLNTIVLGNDGSSPFFAEVTNFKNPFLMGMGFGVRTSILGYFVKADYAVGVEDKDYSKPRLYLSLGRDF